MKRQLLKKIEVTKAVLFDLDGVLARTENLKEQAHNDTLRHFGGTLHQGQYEKVIGRSFGYVTTRFLRYNRIHVPLATYTQEFEKHYRKLLKTKLHPMPGAIPLVQCLADKQYRLGVVSSSTKQQLSTVLCHLGIRQYFSALIASDDVSKNKPDPECYRALLKELRVSADHSVAVEDTDVGIRAAHGAGVKVFAVRHALNHLQKFRKAQIILPSLRASKRITRLVRYYT